MDDLLRTARDGAVATVTMNKPERMNVFSLAMRDRVTSVHAEGKQAFFEKRKPRFTGK